MSRLARSRENWLVISAALAMVSCSSCWALPPSRLSLVVSEATAAGPRAVAEDDDLATTHRVLVEVTERARRLRDQS